MALVTPFFLAVILGIVELGSAFNNYITVIEAARDGARLAARGNVFEPSDVLFAVEQHSSNLQLTSAGSVLLTTVHSDTNGFTATTQSLLGNATSRFDQNTLETIERQATSSDPSYLQQEDFVVLEVSYNHHPITGILPITLPMYSYAIMPVSAPS